MRFVPAKSVEQQDIQLLHRVRSRLVGAGTQIANQVRGLLMEYGIVLPQHIGHLWKRQYAGLGVQELRELRQLREENGRLKRIAADLTLDRQILQEIVAKKL